MSGIWLFIIILGFFKTVTIFVVVLVTIEWVHRSADENWCT